MFPAMGRDMPVQAQALNFIDDLLNPILDDDPLAELVEEHEAKLQPQAGLSQVVTSVVLQGGVDFLPTNPANLVARKAIRVGMAELAARGAVGRQVALGLCINPGISEKWLKKFAEGFASDMREFGLAICASCMSFTAGPSMVTLTAIGELHGDPIGRKGAQVGDLIAVSSLIGAAGVGAEIVHGRELDLPKGLMQEAEDAYMLPTPQWALGSHLQAQRLATSANTIANGLIPDIEAVLAASGLGANIVLPNIPLFDKSLPIRPQLFMSPDQGLLFTIPAASFESLRRWFPMVRQIGEVTIGQGVRILDRHGAEVERTRLEFDDFL